MQGIEPNSSWDILSQRGHMQGALNPRHNTAVQKRGSVQQGMDCGIDSGQSFLLERVGLPAFIIKQGQIKCCSGAQRKSLSFLI